jgi:hypothetical protein
MRQSVANKDVNTEAEDVRRWEPLPNNDNGQRKLGECCSELQSA